ncbi:MULTISPECIES: NADP-dependent oxidoreductase [unclassified Lysobacter]|uniref:NADP-dependent oxidoreductase n=1 Tax=unclassified Lysobacter TaxID=2635362 RepID=UPI001BEAB4F6|nr:MULTISPECIES: NADP-dependent oxidoreductase [unclassified Lysobacter]MBT2747295.1 NADP-dependent oxidoreductase [Lysobacter sp. ISL-42]MBT2753341.1 NADP-dependent oxidoreductase [Lysobacter sp. ISL-50]MBT2775451.1 NADP-dependent oxidoreductase [Lysobacter sp. ISL-54]MBT2783013.1 NADP-dependent oxidoreductase [Lysobacter sp. ISL-52]
MALHHAEPRASHTAPAPPRVKAVVFDRYGPADVLRAIDLPMPQAGPGEIRVRVRAAGVRPGDIALRRGPGANDIGRNDAPTAFPRRLGNEFAGVVDQLGEGVRDVALGDEVMGWAAAMSYAEALTVPVAQVVRKPLTMSWAVAGALPSTGQSAHAALRELRVGAGDTVLIHGAASGIGSVAVQLARIWGARVIASAAAADHDYLRSLGAHPVGDDDAGIAQARALAPRGADAVFDACGEAKFADWIGLGADAARIATLCDTEQTRRLGLRTVHSQRSRERLAELASLHERHGLLVHVREMFPLTRAAEAHRAVERGPARGKVVLMVYEAMPLPSLRLSA